VKLEIRNWKLEKVFKAITPPNAEVQFRYMIFSGSIVGGMTKREK